MKFLSFADFIVVKSLARSIQAVFAREMTDVNSLYGI